ncbi:hypothetical protein CTI12_AA463200 [Artemisia annua]|uniref:Uncharacterized protein n=1 Tax=Artemisia annua TaxID=35608 RepID=A0A2U1LQS0_ARTAN|nr:hypothetical protein CTI12_AA463200 [Artemisia annua]
MGSRDDSDVDDDFSDLYKEYTGPPRSNTTTVTETAKPSKRSRDGSDEEEPFDPNAVPTGFTSRDAKVWEAKSKATEINWKKRKEEEMICKLCGESSHYTQGCPSTLGANRKSQDLFMRVPARDPQVKALFTDKVIKDIEQEIGCKIQMGEKFIIVSGKDGQILSKGVDAVHKIKTEGDKSESDANVDKSRSPRGRSPVASRIGRPDSQRSIVSPRIPLESNTNMDRSRSPKGRSPVATRIGRPESQRSIASPRNASHYNQRSSGQDKVIDEHVREEFHKYPRGSPQAYGNDVIWSRSTHSKSPARTPYTGASYSLNDNHIQNRSVHKNEGRDAEKRVPELQSSHKGSYSTFPQTLEELELEYKRDAMDIAKIRDKEEDDENYRHREAVKELRENSTKRLTMAREIHAKRFEEFLHFETRKRHQQARQQTPNPEFAGHKHNSYNDYNNAPANPYNHNMPMESRLRYQEHDNYPSMRSSNNYEEFQRPRHDDYKDAYNRY